MASLSDKLKSLGVQIGAQGLPPPIKCPRYPIEEVLEGQFIETPYGPAFQTISFFPYDYQHGSYSLAFKPPSAVLSNWVKAPGLQEIDPGSYTKRTDSG
jgi:hypothetical protein